MCLTLTVSGYYVINLARDGETVGWVIIVAIIVAFLLLMFIAVVAMMQRGQRGTGNLAVLRQQREAQALLNQQLTGLQREIRVEQALQKSLPPPGVYEPQQPAIIFPDDAFSDLYDERGGDFSP